MNQYPQGKRLQSTSLLYLCIPFTLDKDFRGWGKIHRFYLFGLAPLCSQGLGASQFGSPQAKSLPLVKNCWEVNRKGVVTYEEAASLEKVSRYHKNLSLKSLAIFLLKISIKYLIRSIDYNSENQKQSKCPTINDCLKKPFLVFIFGSISIWYKLSYFHICSLNHLCNEYVRISLLKSGARIGQTMFFF